MNRSHHMMKDGVFTGMTSVIREFRPFPSRTCDPLLFHVGTRASNTRSFSQEGNYQGNGGSGFSLQEAYGAALGETLERYAAACYDKSKLRAATASDLLSPCLDPAVIFGFTDEQQADSQFPFIRPATYDYHFWVEGEELFSKTPIWLPASLVYVPYHADREEPTFQLPTSSGLACGRNVEEATLAATLELIERDAVMLWWLHRFPVPMLTTYPPEIAQLLQDRFYFWQKDICFFDITTDMGIPTFFVAIRGENKKGEPHLAVGAACRLDPVMAMRKALVEATQTKLWGRSLLQRGDTVSEFREFEDHVRFHAVEERSPFHDFLFQPGCSLPYELCRAFQVKPPADYLNLLRQQMNALYRVVLTTEDIAQFGYEVVKVVAPELIPLTLGKHYALGNSRIREVPGRLGISIDSHLNLAPHPFP